MSEPESKPPPKDSSERESVFKVLDELVSHMYTFRNVSMLLIISAFVLVPISLVIAVLLLSAPAFVPGPEVNFVGTAMINGTPETTSEGKINASYMPNEVFIQKSVNMTGGEIVAARVGGPPNVIYLPAGPPKFMLSGGPLTHQVLDISTVIIIFIAVSIVLSSIYLFIGIKEYSFFSRWNKKFSRYMSLRDKVDRELGEGKT